MSSDKNRIKQDYKFYKELVLSKYAQPTYFYKNFKSEDKQLVMFIKKEINKFIKEYSNRENDLKNLLLDLKNLILTLNKDKIKKYTNEVDLKKFKVTSVSHNKSVKQIFTYFNRFDVVSVQRFLIKQYDEGKKGKTLENLVYLFIPRLIWHEKPIIKKEKYQHLQRQKKQS